MRTVLLATFTAVALAGAGAPAAAAATAAPARARQTPCQRQSGHTIMRRGVVRVLERGAKIFGCVSASSRLVSLWEITLEGGGSVRDVNARFVLVESHLSNQYESTTRLTVFDLASGASYPLGGTTEPLFPTSSYTEERPQSYALGPNGRTAVLYELLSVTVKPMLSEAAVRTSTGQVLVLVGFHRFKQPISSAGPHEINPASLSYDGRVVSWVQGGMPRSASS